MLNPFTGEQLDLPQDFSEHDEVGLGYDVKTNDYKVVRIYKDNPYENDDVNLKTSIYSMKSRAWHNIEDFPSFYARSGVFANGLLYFLACKNSWDEGATVMISLDLSTETYSKKLPLTDVYACEDRKSVV